MAGRRVAVIVAHPDDEALGFGGAMARHVDEGDAVSVYIMATGLAARSADGSVDPAERERLQANARAACAALGVEDVAFGAFPDNRMDSIALLDVVKAIEEWRAERRPQTVYTHHCDDLNVDHEAVARAVLTAFRPLPGAEVEDILEGEVFSSSEYGHPLKRFRPTTYLALTEDQLARKCAALKAYEGELRAFPHPRSPETVEAAARLRGTECGHAAAEAFRLVRQVIS